MLPGDRVTGPGTGPSDAPTSLVAESNGLEGREARDDREEDPGDLDLIHTAMAPDRPVAVKRSTLERNECEEDSNEI